MSIESVRITKCDLCGKDLGVINPSDTLRMILGRGICQAWPLATGNIAHVCASYCIVLDKAKRLGIADYDEKRLIQMYTKGKE